MVRAFALALAVTLSFALANAPAADDWEKVESKEGGFTVQMPGKPTINKSRTRKGAGGDVKTVIIGCEGTGGLFIAYKVQLPTTIVKGTEDAELDAERDSMAKEWNGKVTAERKIRGGKMVGRDFTIRGTPEKGAGVLTIRMREYLAADSVYIVAVISLPNRELPNDTGLFLGSLMIDGVRAAGSPTPDQKGTELAGWGLALDPFKDAEFAAEQNRLAVNVTGSRHQGAADHPILNARAGRAGGGGGFRHDCEGRRRLSTRRQVHQPEKHTLQWCRHHRLQRHRQLHPRGARRGRSRGEDQHLRELRGVRRG